MQAGILAGVGEARRRPAVLDWSWVAIAIFLGAFWCVVIALLAAVVPA